MHTAREREFMELAASGLSNAQIGARLLLSRKTVQRRFALIYAKMGVRAQEEAVALWRNNLTDCDDQRP